MRTLILTDENTFYAPASDDCWVILAKEIMSSYAQSYIIQFPTTAYTQAEYDRLNEQKYALQRKSILKRIKHGPLRNAVDLKSVYCGLELKRLHNLRTWGIKWQDHDTIDIDNL